MPTALCSSSLCDGLIALKRVSAALTLASISSLVAAGAAALAADLDHPIYDCIYVEAAIRNDGELITADRRLVEAVRRKRALRGRVRLLSGT